MDRPNASPTPNEESVERVVMSYYSFIVCTFALNLASRLADHEDPGETKFSVRET